MPGKSIWQTWVRRPLGGGARGGHNGKILTVGILHVHRASRGAGGPAMGLGGPGAGPLAPTLMSAI